MNNLTNFMAAQAPMSGMMAPAAATAALGQAGAFGNGDLTHGAPVGFAGVGADGGAAGGPGGVSPADLDQLQQAYNRTGDRGSQHHPIAEFLYQLTKMLTDDNSEIIEWVDGRIKVHYPERLEAEVLHKYFRHSKFASFQRQLNYFGFRKIAGKGKMSPCSYVNEAATSDIRSLLLIKRKTNGSAARKAAMQQRTMQLPPGGSLDLRANLSALAAGAAAATGQPGVNRLGTQAFNAAALFAQAGNPAAAAAQLQVGQFQGAAALQQKALGGNIFLSNENAMSLLMGGAGAGGQKQPSAENLLGQAHQQATANAAAAMGGLTKTPSTPSIEQLHAQLAASLANRQQNGLNSQMNAAAFGLGAFGGVPAPGPASAALGGVPAPGPGPASAALGGVPAPGPASAALAGGPASAALNATAALNSLQQGAGGPASAALNSGGAASAALNAASGGLGAGLFESASNLKALVGGDQQARATAPAPGQAQLGASTASQQLLSGRLPSSSALFPENLSTMSFGNLLGSSNRLSSLLSLNSFLSRDPSVADLVGVLPQGQLAASQAAANQAAGINNAAQRFQ
ncbi:HSF-type DNA-binding [Seminavis robusta]|uniref:HSF-type DNA-binding n=1 Tax=Seminavis robusta TaxID=568900 RepID=A0A9N8EHZ0_9STRA|nr:HSF-type DNA-binding [Seminavis robusta]|eukprot:Sro1029_g233320.1 HSF-type DNA-binding (572) ;mRNA; r:29360-31075